MASQSRIEHATIGAAVFGSESQAQAALDQLKQLDKDETLDIIDAALVTVDSDGKVKIHDPGAHTTRRGAGWGAVAGGVLGAVFPPSILAGAVAGGAVGSLVGHFRQHGFEADDLRQITEGMRPGEAAVVAVVQDRSIERFAQSLAGYDRLAEQVLGAREVGTISAAVDTVTGDAVVYVTGTVVEAAQPTGETEKPAGDPEKPTS